MANPSSSAPMRVPLGRRLIWALCLLVPFYVVGGSIFYYLERGNELEVYEDNRELYESMKEMYSFKWCEDEAFHNLSFCKSQASFDKALVDYFNEHHNSIVDKGKWSVLGVIFFLTHLGTTIGYGNCYPLTTKGQIATIIFALIGVPIMGYILGLLAEILMAGCVYICEQRFNISLNTTRSRIILLSVLLLTIIVGGALFYSWLENWTILESLYFCFVTLSTVGFGDYLPTSPGSKIFSIFYMFSGLGICASIIATLTNVVAASADGLDVYVRKLIGCGFPNEKSRIVVGTP